MAEGRTPVLPFDDTPANDGMGTQQLAIVPVGAAKNVASKNLAIAAAAYGQRQAQVDERCDVSRWADEVVKEEKPITWLLWFEGLVLILLAGIDNVLAYLTFATVRAFHGRLYNIVDLHLTLLPSVDIILLAFAALGTASFAAMIVLVECLKKPLFHEIMNFRLVFSALPCGLVCGVILYHSERTQWAPFMTLVAVLFTIFVWCFHMRVQFSKSLNTMSRISLDVSWFMALICGVFLLVLYLADELQVITNSDSLGCPYASNERMPVHVLTLGKWYCAPWDDEQSMQIIREPVSDVPVRLSCSDSYVSAFSVSIEPHVFECPAGCLRTYNPGVMQGVGSVVGCGVYAADSSVCVSAIHAGALTDAGGQAIVYGRLGKASFGRCSRNSITSEARFVVEEGAVSVSQPGGAGSSSFSVPSGGRRLVTTPAVLGPGGQQISQAFHFNNLPESREFLWLKSYDKVPSSGGVEDDHPWLRIEANISARIAGIELEDEKIRLGQPPLSELFVQPREGQVFSSKPAQCSIRNSGVFCNGAGSAVVQLNFCSTEVKQCPDK